MRQSVVVKFINISSHSVNAYHHTNISDAMNGIIVDTDLPAIPGHHFIFYLPSWPHGKGVATNY